MKENRKKLMEDLLLDECLRVIMQDREMKEADIRLQPYERVDELPFFDIYIKETLKLWKYAEEDLHVTDMFKGPLPKAYEQLKVRKDRHGIERYDVVEFFISYDEKKNAGRMDFVAGPTFARGYDYTFSADDRPVITGRKTTWLS